MYERALEDAAGLDPTQRDLLELTWRLLEAIRTGDVDAYAQHSLPDLSCYEEVSRYRLDGLEFHLELIRRMAQNPTLQPVRFDLLTPRIQVFGETGIVTYTRLMTYVDSGAPRWETHNETRVFVKRDGAWKMAHFHRSRT